MVEEQPAGSADLGRDADVVRGRVKWFNAAKGFGFITSDGDGGDVFVHLSALRQAGFQSVLEGTTLTCKVVQGPKGLQAVEVIEVDASTAEVGVYDADHEDEEQVVPEGDYVTATVKWFNPDKGYGFVTRGPDTVDVFIHVKTLRRAQIEMLLPGETVRVRIGSGPKGPQVACLERETETAEQSRES